MDPGSPQRQAGSAMHGLPGFVHGRFPALLHAAMAAVEADRHPAVWRYNLVTPPGLSPAPRCSRPPSLPAPPSRPGG